MKSRASNVFYGKAFVKQNKVAISTMSFLNQVQDRLSALGRGSRPDRVTSKIECTKEKCKENIKIFIGNVTKFFRKKNFIESSCGLDPLAKPEDDIVYYSSSLYKDDVNRNRNFLYLGHKAKHGTLSLTRSSDYSKINDFVKN